MIPTIKDLVMYINKALDGNAWNTNLQKIVNWLTDGKTDIKVKNLEISQGGGINNNGSLTQSGDLSVTGNISATGNLSVDGVISGDGSGLTGIVSAAQVSYTPFCVNSGNVDSDGKGDLFKYTADVSTSIEFKVSDETGDYMPIRFTNAKGKTVTLNTINSYDLSQTDNGTYIVYLEENATAVTLTDNGRKLYRQPFAPTVAQDPQPSDIWLDISKEGLTSYIRQSGTWIEANIVPIGTVVVNNHKVQSAQTYMYNNNGYNVNIGDCPSLQANQYPKVVVEPYKNGTNWYRIYSDGWIEQGGRATFTNVESYKTFTVTLLKEMKDTNYSVYAMCARLEDAPVAFGIGYKVQTATNFIIQIVQTGSSDFAKYVNWKAEGYIKGV